MLTLRLRFSLPHILNYPSNKLIGTFRTRAEARRKQQQLEGEAGSEQRLFTIKDKLDRVVL